MPTEADIRANLRHVGESVGLPVRTGSSRDQIVGFVAERVGLVPAPKECSYFNDQAVFVSRTPKLGPPARPGLRMCRVRIYDTRRMKRSRPIQSLLVPTYDR